MTLKTLATIYMLGGLTFLPLLLTVVLGAAWLLLPRIGSDDGKISAGDGSHGGKKTVEAHDKAARDVKDGHEFLGSDGNGAASATFAVLREYHFPSAVAALNARASATGGASNAATSDGGIGDGKGGDGTGSESVYQSMYRSVFNRNAQPAASVLEQGSESATSADGPASKLRRKPVVSVSIYYIVLRHGHLMLYDSPAQLEVRHVISMAHHTISITDGDDDVLPDADLFIKRTAIVLTPIPGLLPNGQHSAPDAFSAHSAPKPFFLFSSTCIEKEDFYHALLSTRASPPIAQPIAAEDLIKLQSTLHSTTLTPETRAFNALVSRIFLSLHRTAFLEDLIRRKVEKKIARVQKPSFIASLAVKSINLGDSAPVLSQPRLKDINISGDLTLSFDLRYNGGVQLVIAAVAKIDLGSRFKTRFVDLVLATSLQRLSGKMLVRVKPPPSNRIWFCFESIPDMDIKVEPIVSTRQITYTFILRAIEERIRGVVGETLVKPNWDDVPFFDTRSQMVRGGIWSSEGEAEPGLAGTGATISKAASLPASNDKSMSMPDLTAAPEGVDALNTATGSDVADTAPSAALAAFREKASNLKRRSVASLPLQHASTMPLEEAAPRLPDRPLRSPSFTSPSPSAPSIALNEVSGVAVRPDDAVPQPKTWRSRAAPQPASRIAAVQAVREMRDRSLASDEQHRGTISAGDTEEDERGGESEDLDGRQSSEAPRRGSADAPTRTNSERSTISAESTASVRQQPNQRKNILAATAAATNAARNWSWNAIANRTGRGGGARQPIFRTTVNGSQASLSPDQPMGRGQPLPPPGTPLPGPQRSLFTGFAGAVGGKGSIKRKPVPALPPRRAGTQMSFAEMDRESLNEYSAASGAGSRRDSDADAVNGGSDGEVIVAQASTPDEVEDDFGPWRENSGMEGLHDRSDVEGPQTTLQHSDEEVAPTDELDAANPERPDRTEHEVADPTTPSESPTKKKPPPLPARRQKHSSPLGPSVPAEKDANKPSVILKEESRIDIPADTHVMPAADEASHVPPPNPENLDATGEPSDNGRKDETTGVHDRESEPPAAVLPKEVEEKFITGKDVEEPDFEQPTSAAYNDGVDDGGKALLEDTSNGTEATAARSADKISST